MHYNALKQRIFEIVQKAERGDRWSRAFDLFLICLIFLSVVEIILESVHSIDADYHGEFVFFEKITVAIFTLEYLTRVWVADHEYPHLNPILARIRWIFSFSGLIDLLAILPFYLPVIIPLDLRFLRMLRIFRLLRIFKLGRYSEALILIGNVLAERKEELISSLFISTVLMIVSSTFMYYLEHDVQPESFPNIVETLWWAVATLTTVGYGDVVPITDGGKFFAGIIALIGVGIIALPTGILSAGIIDKLRTKHTRELQVTCPHCGQIHAAKSE